MPKSQCSTSMDNFEFCIVGYQVIAHWMAYLYIYGKYLRSIDFDLVLLCSLILSKKLIYKHYIWYLEGTRTLKEDLALEYKFQYSSLGTTLGASMTEMKQAPGGMIPTKTQKQVKISP